MGRSNRIYRILKKENRRLTRQSQVLEEAIRRRPSKKSVWSAVDRVWSAESGGSDPSIDWTALQGPIVVFEKHYYSPSKKKKNKKTKNKNSNNNNNVKKEESSTKKKNLIKIGDL